MGAITFSPLAQGLLTDRYLKGIPVDSRAGKPGTCLEREALTDHRLAQVRKLNQIAQDRGQSLAQMALCWNLSFSPVASVLIGASRPEQITGNVEALAKPSFNDEELGRINQVVQEG